MIKKWSTLDMSHICIIAMQILLSPNYDRSGLSVIKHKHHCNFAVVSMFHYFYYFLKITCH